MGQVQSFVKDGFKVFYQQQPNRQFPGQSLMLSVMRSKGINRWPGWERLVDDGDFEIDAIDAAGR